MYKMGQKLPEFFLSDYERQKLQSSYGETKAGHNESLTQVTAVSLTRTQGGGLEGRESPEMTR